jgi:hypothetical protein
LYGCCTMVLQSRKKIKKKNNEVSIQTQDARWLTEDLNEERRR